MSLQTIGQQLMSRFMQDNSHYHLLSSLPSASSDVNSTFSQVVMGHACNFTSAKHLDAVHDQLQAECILPANKYVISSFTSVEVEMLTGVYHHIHPSLFDNNSNVFIPRSYKRMTHACINGQKVKNGQYILARNVFPFSSSAPPTYTIDTSVTYLGARPAKVDYFFSHCIQLRDDEYVSEMFASVSWPMQHPLQHCIGKPYELWCVSAFETCNKNFVVPLSNFVTLLLTAQQVIHDQTVLITVPLI